MKILQMMPDCVQIVSEPNFYELYPIFSFFCSAAFSPTLQNYWKHFWRRRPIYMRAYISPRPPHLSPTREKIPTFSRFFGGETSLIWLLVILKSWCDSRGAEEGENWIKFVKVWLGHNLDTIGHNLENLHKFSIRTLFIEQHLQHIGAFFSFPVESCLLRLYLA